MPASASSGVAQDGPAQTLVTNVNIFGGMDEELIERGIVLNDAGFVTLPDGGRMVLAVFTNSSSTPVADRERAIAETACALYDHIQTAS